MTFQFANAGERAAPSPLPAEFSIIAEPGTDLWRKPPSHCKFDAPMLYQKVKLDSLKAARVTVSANWKTLYDQGGLVLVLPQKEGPRKWVKAGIEFSHGKVHASTVACDAWADWSLSMQQLPGNIFTIELEREVVDGKPGSTLWVYGYEGAERLPLREVTWVFEKADQAEDCWIGAFAAKPTRDEDDPNKALEVSFSHFEIELV
jgi:regulation of enolase protein 1 (concanavalin A-like superfamily)